MLKPLSPGLQLSDLRTISTGPAQICCNLNHQGFCEAHSGSSEVASSQQDPGSPEVGLFQAQRVTVGVDSSNECPPNSPSSPSGSSSGSQCGFYSFVEDPRSPEAELNQAWMVSPQRHAQLATLKMEGGFKLQTYASSRKPQSLFSENGGDRRYQVDLTDGVGAEEEEEDDKLLRKEIIRHQAPRGAPRLMEGSGPTSRTEPLRPAVPSTINKDSINFTAARQQFLRLEQERACVLLKPGSFSNTHTKAPPPEENRPCRLAHVLDSGLDGLSSPSSVEAAWSSRQETPIQREIRLIQQREENLRLARGLKVSTAEMVEIKSKRFQSPLSLSSKDLQQVLQKMQRKDKHQLQADVQEENHLDPGGTTRKADQNKRREERPPSGDTTDFPLPCCPHRHPEERQPDICHRASDTASLPEDTRRFRPDDMASPSDTSAASMLTMDTSRSWRENLQLNGLQSRNSGAPDFIEKEIEEALRREEELRELRAPRDDASPQACSPATQAPRRAESLIQPTGTHL